MKKTLKIVICLLFVFSSFLVFNSTQDRGYEVEANGCYDLIRSFPNWPYINNNIYIYSSYVNVNGPNYDFRISQASTNTWGSDFSYLRFSRVSTGSSLRNVEIRSDRYGTNWEAMAYWSRTPMLMEINSQSTRANDMIAMQNAITHEFGHILGLGHPSTSCTTDIMSYGNSNIHQTWLGNGDRAGIRAKYR